MATLRHALILATLLGAPPALAQGQPTDPAAPQGGRAVTGTGQTKPSGAAPASVKAAPKPASAADLAKAQKAAEARSKAWDVRTKRSMSSICNGC